MLLDGLYSELKMFANEEIMCTTRSISSDGGMSTGMKTPGMERDYTSFETGVIFE